MSHFKYYFSVLLLVSTALSQADCRSHSFFVPRQITTNSVFELALNDSHWYHHADDEDACYFSLDATPFYQQSTRGKELAQYFLRDQNCELTFNEINEDTNALCSLWFGLEADVNTQFTGTFSMRPRRKAYGSYISACWVKKWEKRAVWFRLGFAAMRVEHALRICSSNDETDGPLSNFSLGSINQFTKIVNALNNSDWCFGKFSCRTLKRGGIDDVQLKLGHDWLYENRRFERFSLYLVGTIPTGKRQRSEFIFEPLVGSKHASLGAGLNFDYNVKENDTYTLSWLFDVKYRYVFAADQCRSFDLCENGDWSRYLLVVPEAQHLATEPGINLFSGRVRVKPRSTVDLWTALRWARDKYTFEIGYDFWWRQQEKVSLPSKPIQQYGILDLAGINGVPQSASKANISNSAIGSNAAPSDATFVALTKQDLNLDSGAHPTAFSSTLYGAVAWVDEKPEYELMAGVGAQYEIGHRKAALSQWGIWVKLGVRFNNV